MTDYDMIICGGGVGGCAAALAAAQRGRRVLMTLATDWIGGQLTEQAVPPDEHPWIEMFGATRNYRAFRNGVREYYQNWYPLTGEARANTELNPGNGWVGRLCCEPRVALAVLEAMLAPHVSSGLVTILPHHAPMAVATTGDRVTSIHLRNSQNGSEREYSAPFILDATETGELLPLAGVEYVIGAESQSETGEPHAVDGPAQPGNQQGITHCFALSYHSAEDHAIDRPAQYDFWRSYKPSFWPGPLLGWADLNPITLATRNHSLFGPEDDSNNPAFGFWSYRRVRARQNFEGNGPEISIINWPMNDYWLAPVIDVSPDEECKALEAARQLSLSLVYWLQTEAPHPDGRSVGYPGLKLRPDMTGTGDGLAKSVYIRESRRIRAEVTVCEQHVASALREAAEPFPDSIGIGCYRIDLHPSTGGDNYIDVGCHPFQIPLGTLLPVRVENLLPACKNIGTTHITNGAYRLHPVEWAIGEAAAALACFCLDHQKMPRAVRADPTLLAEFQNSLRKQGVPLEWPAVHPV